MSGRSVAEIVWGITSKPCSNQGVVNSNGQPICPPTCRVWTAADGRDEYSLDSFGEPTVDDLLKWLWDHGHSLNIATFQWNPQVRSDKGMQVSVDLDDADFLDDQTVAPTLLEALSAAVLAVAERGTE